MIPFSPTLADGASRALATSDLIDGNGFSGLGSGKIRGASNTPWKLAHNSLAFGSLPGLPTRRSFRRAAESRLPDIHIRSELRPLLC
jgi:hypothetical protein